MKKVLIVGQGVVGSNVSKEFPEADIEDPAKGRHANEGVKYDYAFVCVPTEMKLDGTCDTSIVESVIKNINSEIFIIKSAVIPGTTDKLKTETNKRIIVSPEYYGATQHAIKTPEFVILGGELKDTAEVAQLFMTIHNGFYKIKQTNAKTAELAKYMENTWLACKVTFCCEFYNIAEKLGVEYTDLRECFIMDPRVNPSHTFVYNDTPYWDSHCLNKDTSAIYEFSKTIGYEASFIEAIISNNEKNKRGAKK